MFGLLGLAVITFVALRLDLQPGATSLLYLIVVVFVSLRAGFISSLGVSLMAVVGLNFVFILKFSSPGPESAGHSGNRCLLNHGLGNRRNGGAGAEVDGSAAQPAV